MLCNEKRAVQIMKESGIDAVIGTTVENVAYLTDYTARALQGVKTTQIYAVRSLHDIEKKAIVIPSIRLPGYIDGGFEISEAYVYGYFSVVRSGDEEDDEFKQLMLKGMERDSRYTEPLEALVDAIKDMDLLKGTIAVDEMHMTPMLWTKLERMLPAAKLLPGYDLIRKIRMVKTDEEIRRLKESLRVIESAIMETWKIACEGTTERQLYYKLQEIIGKEGARQGVIGIGCGKRSSLLLGESDYSLKLGDLLRYDVGCIKNMYWSDTARSYCLGGVQKEKQAKYYTAIKEGHQEAVHLIKPGVKVSELYATAVNTIRKAGIPHYDRPHCGHGIGIEFYDPPMVSPKDNTFLEAGMVINVETPYYDIGVGGFQLEDTVLVTATGFEVISSLPRELVIL